MVSKQEGRLPMPNATLILRKEHDAILKMLDATEEAARRIESGQAVAPQTLEGLLEFFRLFADRCHHGKEEDLLFPLLERRGLPRHGGPTGVMLREHDQGRELIRKMVEAVEASKSGDRDAPARWAEAARAYVELLRAHINKENSILFVVAENMLSPEEQSHLAAEFEKLEVEKMGAGTHERLHASMDKLIHELALNET
jgi:hemerythrin-like domain-containing protein